MDIDHIIHLLLVVIISASSVRSNNRFKVSTEFLSDVFITSRPTINNTSQF